MRALAHSHTSLLVVFFHCFVLVFCFFFFLVFEACTLAKQGLVWGQTKSKE